MKSLIFALLIFSSLVSYAGPGDTPVFPWPTNIIKENLLIEDLQGEWVAYGMNTVWFVRIEMGVSDLNSITIESNALYSGSGVGLLYQSDSMYWGNLILSNNHIASFLIYKDEEGTKMRFAKKSQQFIDLKMYRKK